MKKQLNVQSSIRLKGDQKAFGPGIASLLEGVARLGSLRKRELGISLLNKKSEEKAEGERI